VVFEVMTQVDLCLTSVGRFDSADPVITLMTLIKNMRRHNILISYSSSLQVHGLRATQGGRLHE
jgi:hypothetical protein